MVKIGDRVRVPVTFGSKWRDDETSFCVGRVIQLYPRFAVVQFPSGARECYFRNGPENIS